MGVLRCLRGIDSTLLAVYGGSMSITLDRDHDSVLIRTDDRSILMDIEEFDELEELICDTFKAKVYEIVFGDGAINRDFSNEEVITSLLSQSQVSDTCQTCGCNEFLCGHNRRD